MALQSGVQGASNNSSNQVSTCTGPGRTELLRFAPDNRLCNDISQSQAPTRQQIGKLEQHHGLGSRIQMDKLCSARGRSQPSPCRKCNPKCARSLAPTRNGQGIAAGYYRRHRSSRLGIRYKSLRPLQSIQGRTCIPQSSRCRACFRNESDKARCFHLLDNMCRLHKEHSPVRWKHLQPGQARSSPACIGNLFRCWTAQGSRNSPGI